MVVSCHALNSILCNHRLVVNTDRDVTTIFAGKFITVLFALAKDLDDQQNSIMTTGQLILHAECHPLP